jgi:isohexenylglutaconyl-CoA hydratase
VSTYPEFKTLRVCRERSRLYVTIHRPEAKNALSDEVVDELTMLVELASADKTLRAWIMRGSEGTFCAGADLKGFRESFATPPPSTGEPDPVAIKNRRFGKFLTMLQDIPLTTVGVIEGAAFGGGLGLTCVFDVVITRRDTKFALSETGLGIPPAQIAPFVVRRLGLAKARRLALTGARFDGMHAFEIGLADFVAEENEELEGILKRVLNDIGRCASGANEVTKRILFDTASGPLEEVLDRASVAFARQLRSVEGTEGISAFLEKRPARWVDKVE